MKKLCIPYLLYIVVIILLITSFLNFNVIAEDLAVAVTWTDKKDYFPDETALIFGYGFIPFSQVNVTVIRPDLNSDIIIASTDEFGYFECHYQLDGIHGFFNVTATDGVNIATTVFENCLHLRAKWCSDCCWHIWATACALRKTRSYYIKYFDPAGVERRQCPTYSGVRWFRDNFTIVPSLPDILGQWTVKLYENGVVRRVDHVYVSKMVWTTDSTYNNLVTSFYQGEPIYFKAIGLKSDSYYRFVLETPSHNRIYLDDWTTGVDTLTGSYTLPEDAETGSWKLHVREALDANGACEHHYVDTCHFEVTSAPPPPQYYLTVKTDPEGIVTIPGEGWYEVNTYVNLTAPELVNGPADNIRYRFDYWDIDGVSQGTGINEIQVCMDANHTATAHYVMQYYLNMTCNPPDVTAPAGQGWYDANTNVSIYAPEYVGITPDSSRYRFDGWTTADMAEVTDPSSPSTIVYLDKPKTVTANYVKQYKVTFEQSGIGMDYIGTIVIIDGNDYDTLPVSFWWDEGATHSFAFQSPLVVTPDSKRYVWESTTGLSDKQSSTITVTISGTITGNYKTQYYLNLETSPPGVTTPTGEGWYDAGATASISTQEYVEISSDTRYKFTGWTTADMSEIADSSASLTTVLVDEAKTVAANYKIQYQVTFNQTGLDSSATGTVVTVNGNPISYGSLPFSEWIDEGTTVTYSYESVVPSSIQGKRFVLPDVIGQASPFTVNEPKTITGNYATQYYLTIQVDPSGIVAIPGEGWYNESESVTLTAPDVAGYQFDYWDIDGTSQGTGVNPINVFMDAPHTATAHYTAVTPQFTLTITTTTGGTTNPVPGSYTYDEGTMISVEAIPEANYQLDHWELDGEDAGTMDTITILMDKDHTLQAIFVYSPAISVSISPPSASVNTGESIPFSSSISGGTAPYSYQWYLNGTPVSGATSSAWIFTPTSPGTYYVYVNVTDNYGFSAVSSTATVKVTSPPPPAIVGGETFTLTVKTKGNNGQFTVYLATLTVILVTLTITDIRKNKRKRIQ